MDKLFKLDFYWSDKWQKVINVYKCKRCKKVVTDVDKGKPELEKEHICI